MTSGSLATGRGPQQSAQAFRSGAARMVRAVAFHEYGGPEVLTITEVEASPPGPGQVRVRVSATPVNPADVWLREGGIDNLMRTAVWPIVPGLELAGQVESVGEGVELHPGQRVVAITTFIGTGRGAQAELVTVDSEDVVVLPDGVDATAASTLPMSGLTALASLDRLGLEPGATLGVVGAAGAVGGFVVQLARERGLRVIATCSALDAEEVARFGADEVVISHSPAAMREHAPDGVDGLVDTAVLGGAVFDAVRPKGAVAHLRPLRDDDLTRAETAGLRVELISVRAYQGDRRRLESLVDRAADGRLALRVADTVAPALAATAHRRLEAGGVRGRIVLDWR